MVPSLIIICRAPTPMRDGGAGERVMTSNVSQSHKLQPLQQIDHHRGAAEGDRPTAAHADSPRAYRSAAAGGAGDRRHRRPQCGAVAAPPGAAVLQQQRIAAADPPSITSIALKIAQGMVTVEDVILTARRCGWRSPARPRFRRASSISRVPPPWWPPASPRRPRSSCPSWCRAHGTTPIMLPDPEALIRPLQHSRPAARCGARAAHARRGALGDQAAEPAPAGTIPAAEQSAAPAGAPKAG